MAAITDLLDRVSDSNTGRPIIGTLAAPGKAIGASSINLAAATNWTTTSAIHFSIYNTVTIGTTVVKDPTTQTDWKGTLAGVAIGNLTLTGGTDRAYTAGAIVELTPTSRYSKDLYDWGVTAHNQDGTHKVFAESNIVPTAAIQDNAIATAKIANNAVTGAKLDGTYNIKRQNDTTNVSSTGARIETGWGRVVGNNTSLVTDAVTFQTPFSSVPIIYTSGAGGILTTTGNYPDTSGAYVDNLTVNSSMQTTTGFTASLARYGGATFGSTTTVYYTWIAIGA